MCQETQVIGLLENHEGRSKQLGASCVGVYVCMCEAAACPKKKVRNELMRNSRSFIKRCTKNLSNPNPAAS